MLPERRLVLLAPLLLASPLSLFDKNTRAYRGARNLTTCFEYHEVKIREVVVESMSTMQTKDAKK